MMDAGGRLAVSAWLRPLFTLAGLLIAWHGLVMTKLVPQEYLPGVVDIGKALASLLGTGEFWQSEALTISRAAGGLLLAAVTGIGAALLGARYSVVDRALSPIVHLMVSLPPAALVPLSIFVLGLGATLFAFIIWFACIWTIYLSTANAFKTSEPVQIHVARTFGYSEWAILLRVRFAAASPEIFTGIRIAAAGSLMAAVAAEMLAGKDGLGFMLYDTAFSLRIPEMFALLAVAGVNGVLLNAVIMRGRRAVSGWHDRLAAIANV